ncbi:PREDICTED: caffeic acid 3-O-methyltransferase-like [Nelumbo nucifera]|uniref:Caffeic acid 3-O-methyltransferase-like n=2 Tax=Nelumbo nucifera TaxID=4432 RepID=A0A1U8AKZ9_NELNU|nr:PREDICTED: caffeic acid 3-O-methyltransferase-like [Nelumbo nucifera]DAD28948.1 TPA_asm: hypothetical protein HUJ06_030416 [Nelumbo nucifera]
MASTHDDAKSINVQDKEEENFAFAMRLARASVLPMVLKAAIELDVLEIISSAGPDAYLSPSEIASQLQTYNPDASTMIDRMLRLLASCSVLNCSLVKRENGQVERCYGLAPVCKFLTRNQDGVSIAPLLLLLQDKVFMDSWYHLRDTVIQGGIPFNKAHGMSAFEYPRIDSRFNKVFNKAMSDATVIVTNKILETYKGFEGLKVVVDVGGGIGVALNLITSKYPQIKGINFDLPHVVAGASSYPGVEHVGGDMFESVPQGDAIFMKLILHDWSDEHCLKLLKNCWKALPKSGKIIIVELILPDPEAPDEIKMFSDTTFTDLIMLAQNPGGKERSYKEFEALAMSSAFSSCEMVCRAYNYRVLEFCK